MTFLEQTRAAYDTIAVDYTIAFHDEWERVPIERAMMRAFADMVLTGAGNQGGSARLVGDIGCGAGECARFLAALGLDVVGIDMSAGMLAQARAADPGLRLGQGSMTALPIATGALNGLLAMYSVIHVPDDALVGVLGEFRRVVAPGGQVMLAFQDLDEPMSMTEAFGHTVALEYYFRSLDRMVAYLGDAGFTVHTRTRRVPFPGERTPRAMLLARRD